MSITDVIQQMSAAEGAACELSAESATESKRVSCVVVMDAGKVVGICTERDIVRLTANKITLVRSLDDIVVRDVMTSPVKTLEASAFKDIFAVLFLYPSFAHCR